MTMRIDLALASLLGGPLGKLDHKARSLLGPLPLPQPNPPADPGADRPRIGDSVTIGGAASDAVSATRYDRTGQVVAAPATPSAFVGVVHEGKAYFDGITLSFEGASERRSGRPESFTVELQGVDGALSGRGELQDDGSYRVELSNGQAYTMRLEVAGGRAVISDLRLETPPTAQGPAAAPPPAAPTPEPPAARPTADPGAAAGADPYTFRGAYRDGFAYFEGVTFDLRGLGDHASGGSGGLAVRIEGPGGPIQGRGQRAGDGSFVVRLDNGQTYALRLAIDAATGTATLSELRLLAGRDEPPVLPTI